ncbi:NADH-quinone oxidoreductase subunit NuoF [Anaerolinea thermophila]|uniref:Bidirectional hydrogenase F subunit n=1 Tax=Anaerolinea thermophila (strain DSM 14523 / JCM 11388 / NBRC 100420 / UNI-1) TaxID=926569 RepID=E8N4C2_ANATU|nr:NADH-quinone oxidoreductase subunit NuoF [Anaerolinea thermophila]BAJ63286.1 bidirectional hydrogenase F subunit [Anaerolinea thermophila UNI-1]
MTNEELLAISEKEQELQQQVRYRIMVCSSTGCLSSRSDEILAALEAEVKQRGLENEVLVKKVGCLGLCAAGPIVSIQPDGILYKEMTPEDVPAILDRLGGEPLEEKRIDTHQPFFTRQKKNALENAGVVDPERIEDYIATGGYAALIKVLTEFSPSEVIQEVQKSGLRGRGGAGYPTGLKWSTVAKAEGEQKFVVCNADEGDPGAFMDRSILESDPHRVLEGMIIAAYAVGANQGYVYVRAEYPLAVKRFRTAIRQAEKMGFLGQNICGTPFSFKVDVRLGAGAFVCGEETALLQSVEGNRGMPRLRPPYPAQSGLFGKPTLVNNVETYANIPAILRNGGEWFAQTGTEKSKGTKVFALTGKVKNTGLIEVPMGITLREIVYDIGGGVPDGRKFKAVQTGGPSGGCIPEELLDTPVDYESLKALGSMMGSGGMIVIDDRSDMIDVARYFMEFSMEESCGKCVPCRVGTVQLYNLLGKFQRREATEEDLKTLEELCDLVRSASLCGLGQAAPNPILSTLKYFREEYLAKIRKSTPVEEA